MNRLLALILSALLLLSLCGCASVLDGEISEIKPYLPSSSQITSGSKSDDNTPIITTDDEFVAAVNALLAAGEDSAVFRLPITDNTEEKENELSALCRRIALETPLGSWAVYYITCKLTPIVSYYDAQISISYKRTASEIASLFSAASVRYLDSRLQNALTGFDSSLAFYTSLNDITGDYICSQIQILYDEHPLEAVMLPGIEVSSSPASSGERIMEIVFNWEYPQTILADMQKRAEAQADSIAGQTADTGDANIISAFCTQLMRKAVLIDDGSTLQDTAYSVLVSGSGTKEGFSRAFKALCDRMNIDCRIVNGWRDGEDSTWNLVFCEDAWYHLDISEIASGEDPTDYLSCDDRFLSQRYIWNMDEYPSSPHDYIEIPLSEDSVLPQSAQNTE